MFFYYCRETAAGITCSLKPGRGRARENERGRRKRDEEGTVGGMEECVCERVEEESR